MIEIHLTRRPFLRWRRETLSERATGGLYLGVSTLSASSFNSFAKTLTGAFSALTLLFVSELLTAFFVLFSFGCVPTLKRILRLKSADLRWMIVMGCLSGIAGPMLWFTGLSFTTAINAGFFGKSEMIFLLLLAHFVLREKITSAHFAAIITVLAGITVISLHGFTEGLSLQKGDLLIMLAALCYGTGNIVFRKKLSHIEPHLVLFSRSCTAIATFFLISPFLQHPFIQEVRAFPLVLLPALIGFGFISRFLNSVTYYQAIERLPVTTVSLVGTLDIIGSMLFAFLYLGEPILWYHYLGGTFILLGNILLELLGTHPSEEHLEQHLKQRMP